MGNEQSSTTHESVNNRKILLNDIKKFINADKTSYNYIAELRKDNIEIYKMKNSIQEKSNLRELMDINNRNSLNELNLEFFSSLVNQGINHEVNSTLYKAVTIPKISESTNISNNLNAFDVELLSNQSSLLIDWIYKTFHSDKDIKVKENNYNYDNWIPLSDKIENFPLDTLEDHYSSILGDDDDDYSELITKNDLSLENFNKKGMSNLNLKKKINSNNNGNRNNSGPKMKSSSNLNNAKESVTSNSISPPNNKLKNAQNKINTNKGNKKLSAKNNDFDQKTVNSLLNVMNKFPGKDSTGIGNRNFNNMSIKSGNPRKSSTADKEEKEDKDNKEFREKENVLISDKVINTPGVNYNKIVNNSDTVNKKKNPQLNKNELILNMTPKHNNSNPIENDIIPLNEFEESPINKADYNVMNFNSSSSGKKGGGVVNLPTFKEIEVKPMLEEIESNNGNNHHSSVGINGIHFNPNNELSGSYGGAKIPDSNSKNTSNINKTSKFPIFNNLRNSTQLAVSNNNEAPYVSSYAYTGKILEKKASKTSKTSKTSALNGNSLAVSKKTFNVVGKNKAEGKENKAEGKENTNSNINNNKANTNYKTKEERLLEREKNFANLILQTVSPLKIKVKKLDNEGQNILRTIDDDDEFSGKETGRVFNTGNYSKKRANRNRRLKSKEKGDKRNIINNQGKSANKNKKFQENNLIKNKKDYFEITDIDELNSKKNKNKKKRIRIDIRNLIEDMDLDKNDSSKSSTIINVNEKSRDRDKDYNPTPMLSTKNGQKTANNSYKFLPNFERKKTKRPTPTFTPKSNNDLKKLRRNDEDPSIPFNSLGENNLLHMHSQGLPVFHKDNIIDKHNYNTYNSAFSLMNDKKLKSQISQVSLKKKTNSKKNSFTAFKEKDSGMNLLNLVTNYSPRFELTDYMGQLGKILILNN